jgi:hypothetical protein
MHVHAYPLGEDAKRRVNSTNDQSNSSNASLLSGTLINAT